MNDNILISTDDLEQIIAFLNFCSKSYPDQESRSSARILKEELEEKKGKENL